MRPDDEQRDRIAAALADIPSQPRGCDRITPSATTIDGGRMSEDTRREVTMESLQKSLMIAAEVAAQRVACMQSFEPEAARDWASVARDMTSALEEVRSFL